MWKIKKKMNIFLIDSYFPGMPGRDPVKFKADPLTLRRVFLYNRLWFVLPPEILRI